MYVIVIGGGKVGYYLSKHLLDRGYEVTLIEKDPRRAEVLNSALGEIVAERAARLDVREHQHPDMVAIVPGDDAVAKERRKVPEDPRTQRTNADPRPG